jgi:hypothetical protein
LAAGLKLSELKADEFCAKPQLQFFKKFYWPTAARCSKVDQPPLGVSLTPLCTRVTMNGNIQQFREYVRVNLENIEAGLGRLNALLHEQTKKNERELVIILGEWPELSEHNRTAIAGEIERLEHLIQEERRMRGQVADWKTKQRTSKLHAHADICEQCAVTYVKIASLVIDEAERAAVHAFLARARAIAAQIHRAE